MKIANIAALLHFLNHREVCLPIQPMLSWVTQCKIRKMSVWQLIVAPIVVSMLLCCVLLLSVMPVLASDSKLVEQARSEMYHKILTTGNYGAEAKNLNEALKSEKKEKVVQINRSVSKAVTKLNRKYPKSGNQELEHRSIRKVVGKNVVRKNAENRNAKPNAKNLNSEPKEVKVDLPPDFKNEIHFP